MATTIDTSSNPLAAYGYDSQTGQQLAQSLGLSPQQLASAMATTPQTGGGPNMQGGSYGKSAGFSLPGADQSSTIQQLQMLKAAGGLGGGNQQQGQAPSSTPGGVSQDPMNAATNLGAAALNMDAVYNPTPSQIPAGSKGGVSPVASPVSSSAVPGVPSQYANSSIGNVFSAAPMPTGSTTPNAQGQLPGTPTGTAIPNPRGSAPAMPYATAPAAPGASAAMPTAQAPAAPGVQDMAAHNQALAHAGMSLYSHFGGDPSSASPEDISNFHSQLTGMLGGLSGGNAAGYTAGLPPGSTVPPAGAPPAAGVKMSTGGMVPGRGNGDTVPALLTPGEYVIPKSQAAQIFGGQAPVRMADGGWVTGDDNDQPEEARRKSITTTAGAAPQNQAPSQQGSTAQQTPQSPAPAAPSYGADTNWAQVAQQAQAARTANANVGSGGPGSIDSLGSLGDESIITGQGGPGQVGGPGSATSAATGAIGGLMSGLQQAAQTYASSIKNWTMQKPDFSAPTVSSQPAATFTQDKAQQQKQQGMMNPLMAAQMGALQGA